MSDDYDVGRRWMLIVLAGIAGFVWLGTRASQCGAESQLQEHQRQVECIRQHIYCGRQQ